MADTTKTILTPEEYLAMERVAESKSEYRAGEIIAMSGASRRHNLTTGNVFASLHQQLRKKNCEVFSNDMRVKVSPAGLYTYPDVVVACGQIKFENDKKDTLTNPVLIIEVLSESTEAYDRGMKFEQYRKLESLREYVLISQDKPHIEVFTRQQNSHWLLSEADGIDSSIDLSSIGCRLALSDTYEKLEQE
jgi:Uma2 family endonuclease